MAVLNIKDLQLSQGGICLLNHVNITIEPKERVALIGRNGEGKSTLLNIIAGQVKPDGGQIDCDSRVDIAILSQTLLPADHLTVYEAVAMGLAEIGRDISEYHALSHEIMTVADPTALLNKLDILQSRIEQADGWRLAQRIDKIISELALPADVTMATLSGGWRRRVAIAQVLIREPDLLLLDEPTNHLDLSTILWLEKLLLDYPKAILFITHDRALLRKLATRIIELDRGNISSYPGSYDIYLERKEKQLEDEQKANALFDKKLSQEEVWIRQGIKARRTRNEGRVRNLEKLRLERQARREMVKDPSFTINATSGDSKMVIKAKNISFAYDQNKPILRPFSITVQKGDKIAFLGPNGAGKTTLMNILTGNLIPSTGDVKHSPTNQIAIFDQHRMQIDPEKSATDNVAEGSDMIEVNGKQKHIVSYLSDFLFSPEKSRGKAKLLSGGETNRLLLAKMFAKPANLLVLDEPTNDLDVESLEVLESLLQSYAGTVIIISHDREFVDNIATHSIVFEGDGHVKTFIGGYSDWLWQASATLKTEQIIKKPAPLPADKKITTAPSSSKELSAIMKKIEKLELDIAKLHEIMADSAFYQQSQDKITHMTKQAETLERELKDAYKRWEGLSS